MSRPDVGARRRRAAARGFSLVELMIAMTISLVVSAAVLGAWRTSAASLATNEALAELAERARWSLDEIADLVRVAGFADCASAGLAPIRNAVRGEGSPFGDGRPVEDYALRGATVTSGGLEPVVLEGWTAPGPGEPGEPVPGTDAVLASAVLGQGTPLVATDQNPRVSRVATVPDAIGPGSLALVTDCARSTLVRVNEVDPDTGTIRHDRTAGDVRPRAGGAGLARIVPFELALYYIGRGADRGTAGAPVRSLYVQGSDLDEPPIELVEGVEQLQLLYRTSGPDGDGYRRVDDPGFDPRAVVGVRIGVLVVLDAHRESGEPPTHHVVGGQTVDSPRASSADTRRRVAFERVVPVRNRLLVGHVDGD